MFSNVFFILLYRKSVPAWIPFPRNSAPAWTPIFQNSAPAWTPIFQEFGSNVDADIPVKNSVPTWIPIFQEIGSNVDADIPDKDRFQRGYRNPKGRVDFRRIDEPRFVSASRWIYRFRLSVLGLWMYRFQLSFRLSVLGFWIGIGCDILGLWIDRVSTSNFWLGFSFGLLLNGFLFRTFVR
ncbi:unnamed protein product [Rhizophagus irregularis]|nr:unnamed protein product [Rhizophagus irregularis]